MVYRIQFRLTRGGIVFILPATPILLLLNSSISIPRIQHLSLLFLAVWAGLFGCEKEEPVSDPEFFQLFRTRINNSTIQPNQSRSDISVTPEITIEFTAPVDTTEAKTAIVLSKTTDQIAVGLNFTFTDDAKFITVTPISALNYSTEYTFSISDQLKGAENQSFPGLSYQFETERGLFLLTAASINGTTLTTNQAIRNIRPDSVEFEFTFNEPLNGSNYANSFALNPSVGIDISLSEDRKKVSIRNTSVLDYYQQYNVVISSSLLSENSFEFDGFSKPFFTGLDSTIKKPIISDEELLTLVQEQTFKYFWDYAHPVSGLSRERLGSGELVTMGGSGFGVMGILVGIHRGFITRAEGIERLSKIITFLGNADRFHGVWPHWMNGSTGRTIAFSANDNGADLVETAFMAQGLIAVREYLDAENSQEFSMISSINNLLDTIEWDWFTRGGQNVLYWHWSPDKEWAMNMHISGYNEALIVYILAATSENHGIEAPVYTSGWARNGAIRNNRTFYGYQLPVGFDYGGPLFFAHYSFLGLDPRTLSDTYANYWEQNRIHSLINYEHNVRNPNNHVGYSADAWGLTASDEKDGYGVHEPTRDNGTITPTAALSSFPYTPEESMKALHHFYYLLGDKLWGDYGFYDAFNPSQGWWASSFLAIDQGPILIMIENHRSGLIWDLFMQAPELETAFTKLGFTTNKTFRR